MGDKEVLEYKNIKKHQTDASIIFIPENQEADFEKGKEVTIKFEYTSKIGKMFFNGIFKSKNPKCLAAIDKTPN